MKVRKRNFLKMIGIMVFAIALSVGLAGCGEESFDIDEEAFMNELLSNVSFDCELQMLSDTAEEAFFTVPEDTEMIVYMGNGAYADQAAVFCGKDEKAAAEILTEVQDYTADLKASFEDYIPEEAKKVEQAVVAQKGKYVVLCISSDDGAKSFIDGYFDGSAGDGSSDESGDATGESGDATSESGDASGDDGANTDADANSEANANTETAAYPEIEMQGKLKDYGTVIAVGDTAYELYSYSEDTGAKYAQLVNSTADKLAGKVRVVDVMIPLSSGITLPNELYGEISSSSQKKALNKLEEKMNDNVTVVNPYEKLMQHRDEYIYFRTDHHWTADGAYYAYEKICEETGMQPISREERESVEFKDFLGSFYKDTGEDKELKDNPDTVKAYYPVSENTSLTYTTTEGKSFDWKVIWDVSDYGSSLKYSTFIAGDNPYTVIKNEDLEDGPRCVVVKESFGNALVPFLVDHYSRIYVIDYRYWNGNLASFASEKNVDDLFFLNNLSMIRSDYLVGKLAGVC